MTLSPARTDPAEKSHWSAHVPLSLFAVVMGVAGLGLAWRQAHRVLAAPQVVGEAILALGGALFLIILVLYILKIVRFPAEVRADVGHPVHSNFLAAIPLSLLILTVGLIPYMPDEALTLWGVGAAMQLLVTLTLLGRWMFHAQEATHSNPAWFIPVVGNLVVPLPGVPLGYTEVSWFFFAVGMVFWLLLFTIVFQRIVFHPQLPAKLVPTLFIFIPPPAIGFLSYLLLIGGELDSFARVLFFAAAFLVLLMLSQTHRFLQVPFAITWWAFTFPLAAATSALLIYAENSGDQIWQSLSWASLIVTTVVVGIVLVRTFQILARGRLFVPE